MKNLPSLRCRSSKKSSVEPDDISKLRRCGNMLHLRCFFAGEAHALSRRSLAKTDAPLHPPRPVCWRGVLPRLLCFFCRGGSRRPPAPPAPAKRDWFWCYGMPCVLVEGNVSQIFTRCRLLWRQSGFDLRHARHIRGRTPRTPHGGVQRSPVFVKEENLL